MNNLPEKNSFKEIVLLVLGVILTVVGIFQLADIIIGLMALFGGLYLIFIATINRKA